MFIHIYIHTCSHTHAHTRKYTYIPHIHGKQKDYTEKNNPRIITLWKKFQGRNIRITSDLLFSTILGSRKAWIDIFQVLKETKTGIFQKNCNKLDGAIRIFQDKQKLKPFINLSQTCRKFLQEYPTERKRTVPCTSAQRQDAVHEGHGWTDESAKEEPILSHTANHRVVSASRRKKKN